MFRVTKQGGVVVWVVGDATVKGSETGTSFKQALYFKEIGFNLHDTMIYRKIGSIVGGNNNYLQTFEYMFVFSKGKLKTFNPIVDRKNTSFLHKQKYQTNTSQRKKDGTTVNRKNNKAKEYGKRFNIWEYSPIAIRWECINKGYNHPAIFPEKLAEDHILSWSNEGDTVLDPMCGSGTTLKMAKKNNRKYIGIEISAEYIEIAKARIEAINN